MTNLNLQMFIANFPVTFLILILCVIIFVSIGMIIASFSSSESTAILAAIIIVIPMMFLSGIFIPTEKLPYEIQSVSSYLPLTLAASIMEGASFYNSIPWQNVLLLLLYTIISLTVSYFALKKTLIK